MTVVSNSDSEQLVEGPILVDGHVHFHHTFDHQRFFDGAHRNFQLAASRSTIEREAPGVLFLTERSSERYFSQFIRKASQAQRGPWRLALTQEASSLVATKDRVQLLLLIAGAQVVTSEGLEVLALGTENEIPDGLSLRRTLGLVAELGALPVIPWGVGKWWLQRGSTVDKLITEVHPSEIFLGDTGCRPNFSREPEIFRKARKLGIRILAGSDPLPLKDQQNRVGTYGFITHGRIDLSRPSSCLKALLQDRGSRLEPFGRGESFGAFVRNQIAMQLAKLASKP